MSCAIACLRDGLLAVIIIGGAAGLGGSASDWLDRGHTSRIVVQQRLGPTASRSMTEALRRSEVAFAAEAPLWPGRPPIMD